VKGWCTPAWIIYGDWHKPIAFFQLISKRTGRERKGKVQSQCGGLERFALKIAKKKGEGFLHGQVF
jgi:hypothetical protein